MPNKIFAETVSHVDFTGGVIRVELTGGESPRGSKTATRRAPQQVIFPVIGFLRAFGTMNEFARDLAKSNAPRQDHERDPSAPPPVPNPIYPSPSPEGQSPSPNSAN